MAETERTPIRLRHYTRASSKERILTERRLIARDQHKVFVERADRQRLSPRQAEATYLLKRGKGNTYIEFDAWPEELHEQTNSLTGVIELFLRGDVDLSTRNPQGFDNH
jgi:HYD1 signature containing ADP-ribosyltransferase